MGRKERRHRRRGGDDGPGQPWKKAIGIASSRSENSAIKCIVKSSPSSSLMGTVKCGKELMYCSLLRLLRNQHTHNVSNVLELLHRTTNSLADNMMLTRNNATTAETTATYQSYVSIHSLTVFCIQLLVTPYLLSSCLFSYVSGAIFETCSNCFRS